MVEVAHKTAFPRKEKAEIAIVPATDAHAMELAPRMRAADLREIEAASGDPPDEVLRRSLAMSTEAWAGTVDGEVACVFGVGAMSLLGGHGSPWLLGSDLIERHAFAFARRNRAMVRRWLVLFPLLSNHVDARNGVAIRWLGWLGFDVKPAVPWGRLGLPFHPFEMRHAYV